MMLFDELCQIASDNITTKLEDTWRGMIKKYILETTNWNQNKRILQRNLQITDSMDHLPVSEFKEKLTHFDKELEDMYASLKQGVMRYFEDVTRDEVVKFDYILDGICRIGHLLLSRTDKRPPSHKGKLYEFKALKSNTFPLIRSSARKYGKNSCSELILQMVGLISCLRV